MGGEVVGAGAGLFRVGGVERDWVAISDKGTGVIKSTMRSYDANYRLTDLARPALNLHLARDAMGNIVALGNASGANPATETYRYDPLYRLTGITDNGTALKSYGPCSSQNISPAV